MKEFIMYVDASDRPGKAYFMKKYSSQGTVEAIVRVNVGKSNVHLTNMFTSGKRTCATARWDKAKALYLTTEADGGLGYVIVGEGLRAQQLRLLVDLPEGEVTAEAFITDEQTAEPDLREWHVSVTCTTVKEAREGFWTVVNERYGGHAHLTVLSRSKWVTMDKADASDEALVDKLEDLVF